MEQEDATIRRTNDHEAACYLRSESVVTKMEQIMSKTVNPLTLVPELQDAPVFLLHHAAEIARRRTDAIAKRFKVGDFRNLIILLALSTKDGRLTQSDLTCIVQVNANSMVARMDFLEQHGFVRRVRNEDNRRQFLLRLTQAAKRVVEQWLDNNSGTRQVMRPLAEAEVHQVSAICVAAINNEYQ